MSRVNIALPDSFDFTTELNIRISDLNYGGHLGNDTVLSLAHEARVRLLKSLGFNERDIDGVGLIMTDAIVVYKSEAFYGEILCIDMVISDVTKCSCDVIYSITDKASKREIARVKTGLAFFDYKKRKVVSTPDKFKSVNCKKS